MSMEEYVRPIAWSIELNYENYGNQSQIVSRERYRKIADSSVSTTIDSISNYHKLSERATENMYSIMSDHRVFYVTGDMGEYSPVEKLPIGPAAKKLGNVAILPFVNQDTESVILQPKTFPIESEIYLHQESVATEWATLKSTVDKMNLVIDDNPSIIPGKSALSRFDRLRDPAEQFDTAAKLSLSRRTLKYGLLPNGTLQGVDPEFGFEEWQKHVSMSADLNGCDMPSQNKLQEAYQKDNLALKNLRLSVWPVVSSTIIGIDPDDMPLFYPAYIQNKRRQPDHYAISFDYDGRACQVNYDRVSQTLEQIYNPDSPKLKIV